MRLKWNVLNVREQEISNLLLGYLLHVRTVLVLVRRNHLQYQLITVIFLFLDLISNLVKTKNGDYPKKFEEFDPEGDLGGWIGMMVREFNQKYGTNFEEAMHCCNHCAGWYVFPKSYRFYAWRGEPQKLEDVLPEVDPELHEKLVWFGKWIGVEDPESKASWWLASYGEL